MFPNKFLESDDQTFFLQKMRNIRIKDISIQSRWSQFCTEILLELECPKLFDNEKYVLQDIAIFKQQILQMKVNASASYFLGYEIRLQLCFVEKYFCSLDCFVILTYNVQKTNNLPFLTFEIYLINNLSFNCT